MHLSVNRIIKCCKTVCACRTVRIKLSEPSWYQLEAKMSLTSHSKSYSPVKEEIILKNLIPLK